MAQTDPQAVFRDVAATHPRCFWLDGGGAREWSGRRSLIGWLEPGDLSLTYDAGTGLVTRHRDGRAETVETAGSDPFEALAAELGAGGPSDQWFGYAGYASRPDLPAATGGRLPDAVWMRPSRVRLFEHPVPPDDEVVSEGVSTGSTSGGLSSGSRSGGVPAGSTSGPGTADPPDWYCDAFERVQEQLHAGNTYELNLTFRETLADDVDPVTAYLRLRRLNPAPYAGFLQHDVTTVPGARAWLLSSSPERYALVTRDADGGRTIETKPIKGTTPRGDDAAGDEASRERLASEPKFRAENLMIVDLLRNDLAVVCDPGTVTVPRLMTVESYRSVHQLVSTVRGRLRDDVTTVAALRSLFPAGSMTGAPKLRTMQVIEAVEETPRGAYAGAFGWVAADGRADLGVVIRTLTTAGDGQWELGSGGGITVASTVEEEWAEARLKAERLRRVFAGGTGSDEPLGLGVVADQALGEGGQAGELDDLPGAGGVDVEPDQGPHGVV